MPQICTILITFVFLFTGHSVVAQPVPKTVSKTIPDLYYRDCMVVPENNYSTLVMKPIQPDCPPTDCWKSQLTVLSKASLTFNYNNFRDTFASHNVILGMVKANWHWMLEIEAMKILQHCPEEGAAVIETRNIGGLDYDMSCEEVILTIPTYFKTQADFVNDFPKILNGQQIQKSKYYKLPSVSHLGCAVIFPQNSTRMVCLFCAKANLLSSDTTCPPQYDKEEISTFPHLCAHELQNSVYGCEPTNLKAHCPGNSPQYGKVNGSIRHMYSVTDGDRFLILVDASEAKDFSVHHTVLGCEEQGGQCAPPLPAWNYVYESYKIMELNKTVFFNDNKTFIRYGSYNVFIQMAQNPEECFEKAGCCVFIFIFFLLTAIPVGLIIYFTYKHRKQHPE